MDINDLSTLAELKVYMKLKFIETYKDDEELQELLDDNDDIIESIGDGDLIDELIINRLKCDMDDLIENLRGYLVSTLDPNS